MRTKVLAALAAVVVMPLAGALDMRPASAATGEATIVYERTDASCVGDGATLVWSAPERVSDLTGYKIVVTQYGSFSPTSTTTFVGPEQTSHSFKIPIDLNSFLIYAVTADGVAATPFTGATVFGNRAPQPMSWSQFATNAVGDGTATVTFAWFGPIQQSWHTTGGILPNTVRITASPGGATIESPIPKNSQEVVATFTGLTNGTASTFSAVTSNACGSSASSESSIAFVPGVRPSWTQASPSLTVRKNKAYTYQFAATGDPAPTYRLEGAPAWLTLSPDGVVSGDPPKETTSFSYSIVAANDVGIRQVGMPPAQVVAGPFAVAVIRGWHGSR